MDPHNDPLSLETVRALHQTVVALRSALEDSRSQVLHLQKGRTWSIENLQEAVTALSIENHLLRQKVIDLDQTSIHADESLISNVENKSTLIRNGRSKNNSDTNIQHVLADQFENKSTSLERNTKSGSSKNNSDTTDGNIQQVLADRFENISTSLENITRSGSLKKSKSFRNISCEELFRQSAESVNKSTFSENLRNIKRKSALNKSDTNVKSKSTNELSDQTNDDKGNIFQSEILIGCLNLDAANEVELNVQSINKSDTNDSKCNIFKPESRLNPDTAREFIDKSATNDSNYKVIKPETLRGCLNPDAANEFELNVKSVNKSATDKSKNVIGQSNDDISGFNQLQFTGQDFNESKTNSYDTDLIKVKENRSNINSLQSSADYNQLQSISKDFKESKTGNCDTYINKVERNNSSADCLQSKADYKQLQFTNKDFNESKTISCDTDLINVEENNTSVNCQQSKTGFIPLQIIGKDFNESKTISCDTDIIKVEENNSSVNNLQSESGHKQLEFISKDFRESKTNNCDTDPINFEENNTNVNSLQSKAGFKQLQLIDKDLNESKPISYDTDLIKVEEKNTNINSIQSKAGFKLFEKDFNETKPFSSDTDVIKVDENNIYVSSIQPNAELEPINEIYLDILNNSKVLGEDITGFKNVVVESKSSCNEELRAKQPQKARIEETKKLKSKNTSKSNILKSSAKKQTEINHGDRKLSVSVNVDIYHRVKRKRLDSENLEYQKSHQKESKSGKSKTFSEKPRTKTTENKSRIANSRSQRNQATTNFVYFDQTVDVDLQNGNFEIVNFSKDNNNLNKSLKDDQTDLVNNQIVKENSSQQTIHTSNLEEEQIFSHSNSSVSKQDNCKNIEETVYKNLQDSLYEDVFENQLKSSDITESDNRLKPFDTKHFKTFVRPEEHQQFKLESTVPLSENKQYQLKSSQNKQNIRSNNCVILDEHQDKTSSENYKKKFNQKNKLPKTNKLQQDRYGDVELNHRDIYSGHKRDFDQQKLQEGVASKPKKQRYLEIESLPKKVIYFGDENGLLKEKATTVIYNNKQSASNQQDSKKYLDSISDSKPKIVSKEYLELNTSDDSNPKRFSNEYLEFVDTSDSNSKRLSKQLVEFVNSSQEISLQQPKKLSKKYLDVVDPSEKIQFLEFVNSPEEVSLSQPKKLSKKYLDPSEKVAASKQQRPSKKTQEFIGPAKKETACHYYKQDRPSKPLESDKPDKSIQTEKTFVRTQEAKREDNKQNLPNHSKVDKNSKQHFVNPSQEETPIFATTKVDCIFESLRPYIVEEWKESKSEVVRTKTVSRSLCIEDSVETSLKSQSSYKKIVTPNKLEETNVGAEDLESSFQIFSRPFTFGDYTMDDKDVIENGDPPPTPPPEQNILLHTPSTELLDQEVDDIELIFTNEDTKETNLKEPLISIEATNDTNDGHHLTFDQNLSADVSDRELEDDVFNDNFENENQENSNFQSQTFDFTRENSQVYNSKSDNSINQDEMKSFKSYYSYQDSSFENKSLEKDESFDRFEERIRVVETDMSKVGIQDVDYNLGRRNTCPNPLQYRPIVHREALGRGGLNARKTRPILAHSNAIRRESGAQTDISALPNKSSWASESSLAHKVKIGENFTTLPSKYPLPGSRLRLSDKTVEARRILLSDIGFTSMVPELSRSADHLCPPHLKAPVPTNYGQFLRTTDLYSPAYNSQRFMWTTASPSDSHSQSRYSSLYPLPSPPAPSRRCSAPVSPCRKAVLKPAPSRVRFANGSLPELRGDWNSTIDSGDSTDSLVEEAEQYLRRSIDCIVSGKDPSYSRSQKGIARRASAPEPARDNIPPPGWQPFLPRLPRDLRLDYWVKVITLEGRVRGGRVRYVGHLLSHSEQFVGVQLSTPDGHSDGTYNNRRYFQCEPYHGIFVPFKKVIMGWRP